MDMKELLNSLSTGKKKTTNCVGVYFRGSGYEGWNGNTYTNIVRLKLLKRMSCPGCEECGWVYDQLREVGPDWPLLGVEKIEDGKVYTIGVCNMCTDWETGTIDQCDLEVIEVKDTTDEV